MSEKKRRELKRNKRGEKNEKKKKERRKKRVEIFSLSLLTASSMAWTELAT